MEAKGETTAIPEYRYWLSWLLGQIGFDQRGGAVAQADHLRRAGAEANQGGKFAMLAVESGFLRLNGFGVEALGRRPIEDGLVGGSASDVDIDLCALARGLLRTALI